jgi:4-nitrophenyl phosphatase
MDFSKIDGVILDMDGVLWRGNTPLPGLAEFFAFIRERGLPFVLATNNSRRSPHEYVGKLEKWGVPQVDSSQVVTSGTATVDYLQLHYPPKSSTFVIGGDGLRDLLAKADFALAENDADIVVVGIDFNLTYEKLRTATLLIRSGAAFIGTNPDVTFPTPEGLAPGAGSILALLESATDVHPIVIGKPERAMFETALHRMGTSPDRTLMIGDRLGTDIVGGNNADLKTVLVMTGVTTPELLSESSIKPTAVFDGLNHLHKTWLEST